jgi:hypothetical protein
MVTLEGELTDSVIARGGSQPLPVLFYVILSSHADSKSYINFTSFNKNITFCLTKLW